MSPLELFRRNQKVMMTGLILLSMFAFVVLPAMTSYLREAGPGMTDPVIATFDGKPLRASRVRNFTRMHYSTVQFLERLADETMRRGGTPQVPGFQYDDRSQQIRGVGINSNPSDFASVRTLQFADAASSAGFELDDTAIKNWLQRYTAERFTQQQINGLLARETQNGMGEYHLIEMLRKQLLAEIYQRGALAGIVSNTRMPILTPAEQWRNFLKLNQKATVSAYGLLVDEFVSKTDANPPAGEVEAVYEEGKNRFPSPQSREPGFRRRETATIEYVAGNLQSFVDAEVAKLTDEEIRAVYDKRVAGGEFQMPAEAPVETTTPAESASEPSDVDESKPATEEMKDAPADDKSETPEKKEAAPEDEPKESPEDEKEAPEDEKESPEELAKQKQQVEAFQKEIQAARDALVEETAEPAVEKKEEKEASTSDGDDKSEPAEEKSEEDAAEDDDSDDEESDSEADDAASDDAASDDAASDDSASDNSATDDADASDSESSDSAEAGDDEQASVNLDRATRLVMLQNDDEGDDVAESETTEDAETKSDEETADAKASDAAEEADSEAKTDDAGDGKDDADAEAKSDDAEAEPKIRPFDEVRQQVAESMVQNQARVKLDNAMTKIRKAMKVYFAERVNYEATQNEDAKPTRPDLEAMAKELGLEYQLIGPHDMVTLADEPISKSVEVGASFNQRGYPFNVMIFGAGTQVNKHALFQHLATVDIAAGLSYMSWKVEETEAYTPPLDEVRDEVVAAIRLKEARKLALAAAEEMAQEADGGKSLSELVPEDKKANFKEGLAPFSWMTSFGFSGATIGNVPELDSVGEEFMEKVFTADDGQHVVAANMPGTVVYVVHREGVQPAKEDLQAIFKQPQERMMAMLLGNEDRSQLMDGFYESIDEKTGFDYSPPE